jgi:hypothetical protein
MIHVRGALEDRFAICLARSSGFVEQPEFQSQDFTAGFANLHALVDLQSFSNRTKQMKVLATN